MDYLTWIEKLKKNTCLQDLFLNMDSNSNLRQLFLGTTTGEEVKIHISKLKNSRVKEMMAICSITDDIDDYFKNTSSTKLENSLENMFIIFVEEDKDGCLNKYIYKDFIYLPNHLKVINQVREESAHIIEIQRTENLPFMLKPEKRNKLVMKVKDSKPYKSIYSEIYEKELSKTRYGWYFTKEFLQELYEEVGEKMDNNMFYDLISTLKTSDNLSVTKLDDDYSLFDDLYIERLIEIDLKNKLKNAKGNELILLVGNSGDGKSTILRRLKKEGVITERMRVHNDATESFYPNKDSIETLLEIIEPFSDENFDQNSNLTIVAINMGIIGKLLDNTHMNEFSKLEEFIKESNILAEGKRKSDKTFERFDYFSFGEYFMYDVASSGFESSYINQVFSKIFNEDYNNIFYKSYMNLDNSIKESCPVAINFELLLKTEVQIYVKKLLAYVSIDQGLMLTSRIIWNFIYELLMDEELERIYYRGFTPLHGEDFIKRLLPNRLFSSETDNELIRAFKQYIDILENRNEYDEFLHILATSKSNQIKSFLKENASNSRIKVLEESINVITTECYFKQQDCRNKLNRMLANIFTINYNDGTSFSRLDEYAKIVNIYNSTEDLRRARELKELKKNIASVIRLWNGKSYRPEFMNTRFTNSKFKKCVRFDDTKLEYVKDNKTKNDEFYVIPQIAYNNQIKLIVDYKVFSIVEDIRNGYQLNSIERLDYIKLNEFVSNLVYECIDENEQYLSTGNTAFYIKVNEYDEFIIRRE